MPTLRPWIKCKTRRASDICEKLAPPIEPKRVQEILDKLPYTVIRQLDSAALATVVNLIETEIRKSKL